MKSERELRFIFATLCAAFIANFLGYAFIVPILPSWKMQFGLNNTEATALVSLWAIPLFLLGPITGKLVDRFGAMKIIFYSLVLLSLTSLLYLVAAKEITGNAFVLLATARLLHGLAGASIMTAGFAASSELWPLNFGEVSGKLIGIAVVGGLLGPVVGGLTFEYSQFLAFSVLAAIPALVAPIAFILIKSTSPESQVNKAQGSVSFKVFLKEPMLFRIGLLVVLATIATGALEAGVPLFLQEGLNLGSGAIGLVLLLLIFFQGIGGWFWGILVDRNGPVRYMIVGWVMVALMLIGCGIVASKFSGKSAVIIIILLLTVFQFAIAATQVPMLPMIDTATNQIYGKGSAGLAFGAFGTAWAAGTIIGPMAIGPMLDLTHSWALTLGLLAVPMLIGLIITLKNRSMLTECYELEMNERLQSE